MGVQEIIRALACVLFLGCAFSADAGAEKVKSKETGQLYDAYENPADIPAHVFARDQELEHIVLSPDGKFLLLVEPKNAFYIVRVKPTDATDDNSYFHARVARNKYIGADWGSNNRILLITQGFRWHRNMTINRAIHAAQHDAQNTEPLLRVSFKKEEVYTRDTILHNLPDNPNKVLVTYSENGRDWPAIYTLDIYTGETEKVADGYRHIVDWYPDGDGNVRLGMGWDDDTFHMVAKVNPEDEWREIDTGKLGDIDRFSFMGFDPEKKHIVYIRNTRNEGRDIIYEFDLRTSQFGAKKFDQGTLDAGWFVRHQHDKTVLAAYTLGDNLQKHYFDDHFEKMDRSLDAALPGRDNYIYQLTHDSKSAIVFSESDRYPGGYYHYDFENKKLNLFSEVNPALNPDYLSPMKAISYEARDGLKIPAYLTLPQDKEPKGLPLVVMPHGGPWVRDYQTYDFWAQFIASRGYAVLQPNFRGSDGFGRAFQKAGDGEWGAKMITDLVDGVDYLESQGVINAEKVCIVGASYGGYAALMGALTQDDTFRCALAVAPIADLKMWTKHLKKNAGRKYYDRVVGNNYRSVLKNHNPVRLAKNLTIPLVLIHGAQDDRVSIEHSQTMIKALKKAGKPYKFVELESEGHSLAMAKSRTRVLRETERLLSETFKE